jgi:hypothetical protein
MLVRESGKGRVYVAGLLNALLMLYRGVGCCSGKNGDNKMIWKRFSIMLCFRFEEMGARVERAVFSGV